VVAVTQAPRTDHAVLESSASTCVLSEAMVTVWSSSCPSSRWMSARLSMIWSVRVLIA
jgi:hypothetical protein